MREEKVIEAFRSLPEDHHEYVEVQGETVRCLGCGATWSITVPGETYGFDFEKFLEGDESCNQGHRDEETGEKKHDWD